MKEKKLISFDCEKKFYYFFIFWISEFIIIISENYIPDEYLEIKMEFDDLDSYQEELENKKINQLIFVISKIISKLFAGLGAICNYELSINKDENFVQIFLLIIISMLLFLCKFKNFLYYLLSNCLKKLNDYNMDWKVGIYIASTIIFCKYVNREIVFYRHHKVSIIVTLIAFCLMTFVNVYSIIKEDKDIEFVNKIIYIIINASTSVFFPFVNSIYKILMNHSSFTPIKLIFWIGIIETILLAIILPILYLTKLIKLGYINFKNDKFIIWIFIKISYIILFYVRSLMVLKIINYFNPAYMFFMISINSFISFVARLFMNIENSIYKKTTWCICLDCFSLIIIILGTLIFNEILIIHKCGLDKKIKKQLLIEERNEDNRIYSVNNEDDEEGEEAAFK